MARYATSEPMYRCSAPFCDIHFSDREGIKVLVGTPRRKTHIRCPKRCVQIQLRHVATYDSPQSFHLRFNED